MLSEILHRKKFETIYTTHYLRLYCYAMSITGDKEASRDMVEEVFTRLWSNMQHVEESNIYPYLARSIYHLAIDNMRREIKLREIKTAVANASSPIDEDYSEEQEKDRLVYQMIASLKPPADTIVKMKYLDGMKYAEIAQELDMSVNTVKKHIVKALKRLREIYNNKKKYPKS